MNYSAPAFGVAPVAAAAKTSTLKIIIIVTVVVVVGTVIFLGAVAIALGVGLGIGLKKSSSAPSKLPIPIVNCNPTLPTCGCPTVPATISSRIINGNNAAITNWPWMAIVVTNATKFCSGILVSRYYVITAASCVTQGTGNITVYIGVNSYTASVTALGYNSTAYAGTDISVIALQGNVTYGPTIQPCCITPDITKPQIGDRGVITGWGETSATNLGILSGSLQEAVIQVNNPSSCGLQSSSTQFCAGYGSISACPLDIGSPIMTNVNNAWTCVGIITGRQTTCTNSIIFTRIANYYSSLPQITY
jgi:secreted trypsin-like serine protease